MFKGNFSGTALTVLVFLSLAMFAGFASASTASPGGSSMPGVSALQQIRDFISGPFAYTASLLGIVTAGTVLALGGNDMSAFVRTLLYLALVISLIVGGSNFLSTVFPGALIP